MVRRVHDNFVFQFRIVAGQQCEYVGRLHDFDVDIHGNRRRDAERHRLEIAVEGSFPQCIEIVPAHRHELSHGILGHPCIKLFTWFLAGWQFELGAGVGRLQHLERISC